MLGYESKIPNQLLQTLCEEFGKHNGIPAAAYKKYNVKRGLRNEDGTGVLTGLTQICNVHGFIVSENELTPVPGELIYRGMDVTEIVEGFSRDHRLGYEETVYLLLMGVLPDQDKLEKFTNLLSETMPLPDGFSERYIMNTPSINIMNKLQGTVLSLYSFDDAPEDASLTNMLRQSIELIAKFPAIAVHAYQARDMMLNGTDHQIRQPRNGYSIAENILYMLKGDAYTQEEVRILDLCLVLHAEHGGGNNSTFTTRVLTSSGTDIYSTVAGALASLKGPKHGGANEKVTEMFECIKDGVSDWNDDDEVTAFLIALLRREAGDKSGLIYGMGHAVYTLSDPRAVILKKHAERLLEEKGLSAEIALMEAVERLSPQAFALHKENGKAICANVDMYSGFIYRSLGIPDELFTPIFAIARVSGWCAHRIEEMLFSGRIMRPAFKSIARKSGYIKMEERK